MLTSMRKCVSASGSPPGLPACPACLCESLMTFRAVGARASCSFLSIAAAVRNDALSVCMSGRRGPGRWGVTLDSHKLRWVMRPPVNGCSDSARRHGAGPHRRWRVLRLHFDCVVQNSGCSDHKGWLGIFDPGKLDAAALRICHQPSAAQFGYPLFAARPAALPIPDSASGRCLTELLG